MTPVKTAAPPATKPRGKGTLVKAAVKSVKDATKALDPCYCDGCTKPRLSPKCKWCGAHRPIYDALYARGKKPASQRRCKHSYAIPSRLGKRSNST